MPAQNAAVYPLAEDCVSEFSAIPPILLTAVALALIIAGLLGFQQRSVG